MYFVNLLRNLFLLLSPMATRYEEDVCPSQPTKSPSTYTIVVEGNIGSGKSTLLEFLAREIPAGQVEVVFEPVSAWENISGTDLLQKLFDDQERWSGAFQLYSSLTR